MSASAAERLKLLLVQDETYVQGSRHLMTHRMAIAIGLLVSGAMLVALVVLIATADCRTNYRYLMWKWGYGQYDPETSLRYMCHDCAFRQSLVGKTKTEIRRLFPRLAAPADGNQYQRRYANEVQKMDFVWIDESNFGFEFVNGRVKAVHLIKG